MEDKVKIILEPTPFDKSRSLCIVEYQPDKVKCQMNYDHYKYTTESGIKDYEIKSPNNLFFLVIEKEKITKAHLFATKKSIEEDTEQFLLKHPIKSNVSTDGRVCWGNVPINSSTSLEENIKKLPIRFFESGFSHGVNKSSDSDWKKLEEKISLTKLNTNIYFSNKGISSKDKTYSQFVNEIFSESKEFEYIDE